MLLGAVERRWSLEVSVSMSGELWAHWECSSLDCGQVARRETAETAEGRNSQELAPLDRRILARSAAAGLHLQVRREVKVRQDSVA